MIEIETEEPREVWLPPILKDISDIIGRIIEDLDEKGKSAIHMVAESDE